MGFRFIANDFILTRISWLVNEQFVKPPEFSLCARGAADRKGSSCHRTRALVPLARFFNGTKPTSRLGRQV